MPSEYTFFDLHVAIQDAFGWTDSHLHQFFLEDPYKRRSVSQPAPSPALALPLEDMEVIDERGVLISECFKYVKQSLYYEYDFGDGWMHELTLEGIREAESSDAPSLLDGEGACPPEDCGGIGGYADLIDSIKDPKHESHNDMMDWLGISNTSEFDPVYFNRDEALFRDPKKVLRKHEAGFGLKPLKACKQPLGKKAGNAMVKKMESSQGELDRVTIVSKKSITEMKKFLRNGVWEIDYQDFFQPLTSEKDNRTYIPKFFLIVDQRSYFIFTAHISEPDMLFNDVVTYFFQTILSHHTVPEKIHVRKTDLLILFRDITKQLGIEVAIEKPLRSFDSAARSMKEYFLRPSRS